MPDSARMRAIAARKRGRGRIQVAIRRAFISANGKPCVARNFLRWAYPWADDYCDWMRWSVHRALPAIAVPVGRSKARGTPIVWAPRPELRRLIDGD